MIHYDSIHDVCITVPADDEVKAGNVCSIGKDGILHLAPEGDKYDGMCLQVRNGYATLQIHGVMTAPLYTTGVSCGATQLLLVGDNTFVYDPAGKDVLVLEVDEKNLTVTFFM